MNQNLISLGKRLSVNNKDTYKKNLPTLFFFTDSKRVQNIFRTISSLPKGSAIIVREYHLKYKDRLTFIKNVQKLTLGKNIKIIIGKNYRLALESGADGVHYSDLDKINYKNTPSNCKKEFIVTYSCHSFKSILQAKNLGFDLLFYSPIFSTKSHQNSKLAGVLNLAKVAIACKDKVKIGGLGGVKLDNINRLLFCKISAIGAIDFFISNIVTDKDEL